MTNQLSSSADGCMDTYLTLSGEWEIPAGYESFTDGYVAEISNYLPDGALAGEFKGTCFWAEGDKYGRFCTTAIADREEDFLLHMHDISYYFDPQTYYAEEEYYGEYYYNDGYYYGDGYGYYDYEGDYSWEDNYDGYYEEALALNDFPICDDYYCDEYGYGGEAAYDYMLDWFTGSTQIPTIADVSEPAAACDGEYGDDCYVLTPEATLYQMWYQPMYEWE
jgi:hypothetical protein